MTPLAFGYSALIIAIVLEVVALYFLKQSQQFTRLVPTICMAIGYLGTTFFLSVALKTISTGIAYAIWSGLGIVLVAAIGWWRFGERLDTAAIVGLTLILTGVIVLNVFSQSIRH